MAEDALGLVLVDPDPEFTATAATGIPDLAALVTLGFTATGGFWGEGRFVLGVLRAATGIYIHV